MNYIKVLNDPLDVTAVIELASHESCGAIASFIGTTRDNFDGKKVISLEYEAYESMAVKEMEAISNEIRSRYSDVVHIVIYHRLGVVGVKEPSVIIAISSPHRRSALDAVNTTIEELKKRVPIFKKEIYNDDTTWKENKEYYFKRSKSSIFDPSDCVLGGYNTIPSKLLQITTEENELNRRIQSFLNKKRSEINEINIADYTKVENIENKEIISCARTGCFMEKQHDSKGHLKVRHANNAYGPQIRFSYKNTLNKFMPEQHNQTGKPISVNSSDTNIGSAVWERLANIENHINITMEPQSDIFSRLKLIEDVLLHLESVSPEYRHFLANSPQIVESCNLQKKHNYTVSELNGIINNFK